MPNIIDVTYARSGESTKTNQYGMREMQEKAYAFRESKYLLIKAPPASGKSRALMFIALDKLEHQDIKKVIILHRRHLMLTVKMRVVNLKTW